MTSEARSGKAKKRQMLAEAFPDLALQWHPTLNGDLTPENTTPKSANVVWWLGDCGHEWDMIVFNRTSGRGCPVCSGRRVLAGFNDLASQNPGLAQEWDYELNNGLLPTEVTAFSSTKVWWKCSNHPHSWEATVSSRNKTNARGNGCPYCGNRKVLAGFNDLEALYPDIAKQWHPDLNEGLLPSDVLAKSTKKVYWQCTVNNAHYWKTSPQDRIRGSGCAMCASKFIVAGINDLETMFPEVAKEWHPELNKKNASEVAPSSRGEAWWICSVDDRHVWKTKISARTVSRTGCPYCMKRRAFVGQSDLGTVRPLIAAQWHPTKNGDLTPQDVSIASGWKIWWHCPKNSEHVWKTTVYERTKENGTNCPHCFSAQVVSKAETEVADFIESLGLTVSRSNRRVLSGKELDVYVPEKNVAVEFNGLYWHSEWFKEPNYHADKWALCKDKGIQLIQVWEDDWRDRPEDVKRMLAHKLGFSVYGGKERVFARKTVVRELSSVEVQGFLEENHIQGFVGGAHYLGLVDGNSGGLVAVMVLKRQGEDMLLARYATSTHVVGGQSKLVRYAERNFEYRNLVTFADLEVSDGSLYEVTGFIKDRVLPPDYKYLYGGRRQHKFRFRIERFREDPALLFEEGMSERELALLNEIPRVWDSGKIRFVKASPVTGFAVSGS